MSECNRIKPAGVSWIATECINLKTLSLAYQAGVTDQAMQLFFYNCHQLKHVDVSGCRLLTDTAFVPLFEAEEDRAVKIQLETLNVSGLDLLSASLIHYILSKLDSLQELCLGVTYDLDEADSILETMNNISETTRFYMDTEKYYTICKIRNREIFASSSDNISSGLSTSTRATTISSTAVNINRMLVLPSSSTWSLPPPLFPL
ncbi:MAG: hypothetical protein EXX96DRAFT_484440 [Benjaminiella poitrasii]|nr:MAG: hypothetical protein EXX96DRAFT_484440 [Benjaminiella poitrasii]